MARENGLPRQCDHWLAMTGSKEEARMQEGYWITRTYEAGAVGEKIKFFVPGTRPDGKIRRRQRDEIRKKFTKLGFTAWQT